jgi:hypothetical protein
MTYQMPESTSPLRFGPNQTRRFPDRFRDAAVSACGNLLRTHDIACTCHSPGTGYTARNPDRSDRRKPRVWNSKDCGGDCEYGESTRQVKEMMNLEVLCRFFSDKGFNVLMTSTSGWNHGFDGRTTMQLDLCDFLGFFEEGEFEVNECETYNGMTCFRKTVRYGIEICACGPGGEQ